MSFTRFQQLMKKQFQKKQIMIIEISNLKYEIKTFDEQEYCFKKTKQ